MPSQVIHVPAIGEGLQEARIVQYLKKPGETVKRDEPLYEMETDKAVMAVESPVSGVVEEWLVPEGEVVPIGAEVLRMNTDEKGSAQVEAPKPEPARAATHVAASLQKPAAPRGNLSIPPRTRAYAKEKGLAEDALATIPAKGSKLTPADIDAYLQSAEKPAAPARDGAFAETPLSQRQRTLAYRLNRGAQVVVPGTIERPVDWSGIEAARQRFRDAGGDFQPSTYTIFAYGVAQAAKAHPKFRSSMPDDSKLRTYHHINLGTAVALPDDELVTAVVPEADTLDFRTFAQRMREAIDNARKGQDQATESTQLTITNMAAFGLRTAVPVLVSPAASVLFLGEPYDAPRPIQRGFGFEFVRTANLSLTFDHRLINGVGAAHFLSDVCERTENVLHYLKSDLP